ncbi:hypothetical protein DFS34DRAFT_660551 [Phlyctochytrium arcticum]|nr:hypothetical protein DFS34DRAFT_652504 [Phlyctochytrium arcticum]KAI9097131.1 hypothetical protein DFS34DRAFT_660551 [Phlyctochytrium arcticum]
MSPVVRSPIQRATPSGFNARAMTPFGTNAAMNTPTRVSANNAHIEDNADSLIGDFSQDLLGLGLGESGFGFEEADITQTTIRGLGAEIVDAEIGNEALDLELEKMEQELERLEHLKEMKRVKLLRLAKLQRKVEKARLELGAGELGNKQNSQNSHVPATTAHHQPFHDIRNPYQTPIAGRMLAPDPRQTTRGSAMTATPRTNPLASQHELGSIQEDRKAELWYKEIKEQIRVIRDSIVPEICFKGKVGENDKRTLMDFETEIVRAFEEQELDVYDKNPRFQKLVLFALRSFLHPDAKAYEMYRQRFDTWRGFHDFLKDHYLRFLKPNSDAAVLAEWEASCQGSKTFLEWKSELDRLWETVGVHMNRHIYITKLKEKAHPDVISKMGANLHRLSEADWWTRWG